MNTTASLNTTAPQTLNFDSGVTVNLNKEKVTVTAENGSSTIESKHLDSFHHVEFTQARITAFALFTRTILLGTILMFFAGDQWKAMVFKASALNNLLFWGAILVLLFSLVILFTIVIDALLELKIYDRLINSLFSNKGYKVTIGNRSGNNIVFFAQEQEVELIKSLEEKLEGLKKNFGTESPQPSAKHLDDLKKLGDLYQGGILTKDEFDRKKTEILSK